MSFNALNTATAGLRLTMAQIGLVSQNVANSGTVGYVRRTLDAVTTGTGNSGVAIGTIDRQLDAAALKQLRLETSGAAYTSLNAQVRTQLDRLYGVPGDSSALSSVMNGFASALQALASDPNSVAARATVVDRASALAGKIGSISHGVQDLRSAMEAQLSQDTSQASELLSSVARLNTRIAGTSDDAAKADLLDQRDQALNALSGLMDVQVQTQRDGTATVLTGSGVTLVDHGNAASLSFDSRGTLYPQSAFGDDPASRGVGTIVARTPGGGQIDLVATGAIRSGSIAAAIELRDTGLVQAQRQLDDLAGGLARAMSDKLVAGTPASAGGQSGFDLDLTGLSAGNAITLAVRDASGAQRNVILMPSYLSPPPSVDPAATDDSGAQVIPFTIPEPSATRDPATIRSAIAAALGPSYTVSAVPGGTAGAVRILTHGGAGNPTLQGAQASVTQSISASDTRNGNPQLPLFVDAGRRNGLYTGSFDGDSQLTGFAQRIAVNPAVSGNTASLVSPSASTPSGDTSRPQFLYNALTSAGRTFSSSSGIGGVDAPYAASVSGFTQGIVAAQGGAAASAQDMAEGQGIALATAQARFASDAGVNIDEEMSKLIELQTAYTANARVLTAAREMLDTLLRI